MRISHLGHALQKQDNWEEPGVSQAPGCSLGPFEHARLTPAYTRYEICQIGRDLTNRAVDK